METMRREGFELQVGRPRVLYKTDENGNKIEPIEEAAVDVSRTITRARLSKIIGTAGGIMGTWRRRDLDAP